jgi:hypothetical protein
VQRPVRAFLLAPAARPPTAGRRARSSPRPTPPRRDKN